ncbi:hypothetical protein [Xenorhabdus bharatensis]|uniref:hypothetical protein n=1 Tax=Xenorhabdus bharatensis TaxID=3136256 RepID=UPI0030F4A38C
MFKSYFNKVALGATLASVSVFSFADDVLNKVGDVDLTALTNSIGFAGVLVAMMAVAGSLITLYAGVAGIRWVLRTVKGA